LTVIPGEPTRETRDPEDIGAIENVLLGPGSPLRSGRDDNDVLIKNEAKASRAAAGSTKESRSAPPKTPPTQKALVQRVYNTIDSELTKLEHQKGLTSQDRERASRALSQMVNALEKAVDMQREMTKRKTKGADARSKEALAHAEDLRREIAERLERLNRKRASVRSSR
jgi:cellobiose-specific phosphotransferase system component IIA